MFSILDLPCDIFGGVDVIILPTYIHDAAWGVGVLPNSKESSSLEFLLVDFLVHPEVVGIYFFQKDSTIIEPGTK